MEVGVGEVIGRDTHHAGAVQVIGISAVLGLAVVVADVLVTRFAIAHTEFEVADGIDVLLQVLRPHVGVLLQYDMQPQYELMLGD